MNSQANYQALLTDDNEAPHESVIFHVASEGGKSRWNHVEDLDSFFRRLYAFHQRHGFFSLILEDVLNIILVSLILFCFLYISNCVFFNFDEPSSPLANRTNIHLDDLFESPAQCMSSFGFWSWLFIIITALMILHRIYNFVRTAYSYQEVGQFYELAMKMPKSDIDNITWHEVQCRLREVQHEEQICVHKSDLTDLDIYHRILRHKNYMVAMVNKNILPLKYNIKFLGEWVYLSSGLEYNVELLLFGSLSVFKDNGSLRGDYKKYSKRKEVAYQLSKHMMWCGLGNLILAPFIFMYQCLAYYVTYSNRIRVEPGFLSTRTWSRYSRLYLRHFNELDHELNARLSRAYKPAREYMRSFSSPVVVTLNKFITQLLGSAVVFFAVWSFFIERLLLVPHVLLIITVGTGACYVLNRCLPDENNVYQPDQLMRKIIAEIHYAPDHFKSKPHTSGVRDEYSQLYQYTFVSLLEDLISPIVTPLIILFVLRPRALDIVDFFRSFTVDVAGVGDVCSFALMDVSRHGNHQWLSEAHTKADQYQQAEDGKTELSLIHFTLMNPHWKPPPASDMFINDIKNKITVAKEQGEVQFGNPFYASLNSLSTMGSKYASLVNSIHQSIHQPGPNSCSFINTGIEPKKISMTGNVNQAEGPPYFVQGSLLASLCGNDVSETQSLQLDVNMIPMEVTAADMSFSALYLHNMHEKHLETTRSEGDHRVLRIEPFPEQENNRNEELPLLEP